MGYTAENQIPIPDYYQSLGTRQPKTNNYLMNTSFRFIMDKSPNMVWFCQRVNIPDFSLNAIEQPTRFGARSFKAGDKYNFGDLNISFLVDENMDNYLELHDWLRSCANLEDTTEFEGRERFTTDAELIIVNSAYRPVRSIRFKELIPESLGSVDFESTTGETEPIIVDASFKFVTYEIKPI